MMIGVDGNEANVSQRVGVNVWAWELLKELRELADSTPGESEPTPGEKSAGGSDPLQIVVYLSRPSVGDMPPESDNFKYRVIGPGKLWTRWRLPLDLYLHRPRPDVFLSLSHYAPKWSPVPSVVSIMDLSFLEFPRAFKPTVLMQLTRWTEESVKKAAGVIAISEFTKREVVRHYGYPADRVGVVYSGISERFLRFKVQNSKFKVKQVEKIKEKYGVDGKYFLFVGTRQPKKNLARLIEAFTRVKSQKSKVKSLVVVGKVWKQFSTEHGARDTGQIKYLGFVADEDLPALVYGAEAMVIPSLYEGFGIPVVEAMAMGTLVAVSNVTSLPEVAAGAGVLFDPTRVEDIARKLLYLLEMPTDERKKMVKKGMIRSEKFSWPKAAERVLRLLRDVYKN